MTVFNISNSYQAFMLTYLSQDWLINDKNETLNFTQGLRNGLIKKYWKGVPLHLWWFCLCQFSQAEMHSPLFFSLYESKLGLATGKKWARLGRYREISEKELTNVVCSSPPWMLIWTHYSADWQGHLQLLQPWAWHTQWFKLSLPSLYSGHPRDEVWLGRDNWGHFPVCLSIIFIFTHLSLPLLLPSHI